MIGPKKLVLGLTAFMMALYGLSSLLIGRFPKVSIREDTSDTLLLLNVVEKYEFRGEWLDRLGRFNETHNNFAHNFGSASMRIFIEKFDRTILRFVNMTIDSDVSYTFLITLNDGRSTSANKLIFKLKVPIHDRLAADFNFERKMTLFSQRAADDCLFSVSFSLARDRFAETRVLEDLGFALRLRSVTERCRADVNLQLRYNDHESHHQVIRFLVSGCLLAVYDLVLVLYMSFALDNFEYNFKFQSVLFWSSVAMLNCLFCFSSIYHATDHTQMILFFLFNATLNFVVFALIVLKILQRIGGMLAFAANYEQGVRQRQFTSAVFYFKIYAVIIVGMFYGMKDFPTPSLMYFASLVFFFQVVVVALVNERFFSDLTINFALAGSKLLFCVA